MKKKKIISFVIDCLFVVLGFAFIIWGVMVSKRLYFEEYANQISLYGVYKEDLHTLVDYPNKELYFNILMIIGFVCSFTGCGLLIYDLFYYYLKK